MRPILLAFAATVLACCIYVLTLEQPVLSEMEPRSAGTERLIIESNEDVEFEDVVENPVITHETVEVTDHFETD